MEISPDQAIQIKNTFEASQIQFVYPLIFTHSIAVVVTIGSAVLLIKTAVTKLKSRFLKHLAVSVFSNVAFRLGSIFYLLLKAVLAYLVLQAVEHKQPTDALVKVLNALETTWRGIDITISLLSSVFLFAAWDLLRHYPNRVNVSQSLFGVLTAVFGTGSILTIVITGLSIAERIHEHLWQVLDCVDLLGATFGLIVVGWQLQKTLGVLMTNQKRVLRATLPWATAFFYFIWGIIQPLYHWLGDKSWYSVTLVILGFCSTILTIILCSLALEDKLENNMEVDNLS
jgi:hypothetical protein